MDSIVHSAVEEICARGTKGLSLVTLWPNLHPALSKHGLPLCPSVKQSVWSNLLTVPGLQFEASAPKGARNYGPQDNSIQSVEQCEKMNLNIIASEHLRHHFCGIYDIKASNSSVSDKQLRILERIAIARENGVTQNELAKEFGIKGNMIFYQLKILESRGLIVRQSTIIRTKEAGMDGERRKSDSIVSTNMVYLYRYAKHLGCQQRLEIIKEDKKNLLTDGEDLDRGGEGSVKGDVHVKDYLPALKAICDTLDKYENKVGVISQVKQNLGYRGTHGHRTWRNLCHRLKSAGLVEDCYTVLDNKEEPCLRLLKQFSPSHFEAEQITKGKRGRVTDQLVELPIDHQIYDLIDAEGPKGILIAEAMKRLGLNNKQYHNRFVEMSSKFGMHLQGENYNRNKAYRVWTSGNFYPETSDSILSRPESVQQGNECNAKVMALEFHERSAQTMEEIDVSISKRDVTASGGKECIIVESDVSNRTAVEEDGDIVMLHRGDALKSSHELSSEVHGAELQLVSTTAPDAALVETLPHDKPAPRRRRSYQRYPCLTFDAVSAQREQRILKMLQEETFLIKPELHRRLESLEKDKQTTMDRKTLERILNKLQKGGHCKCVSVSVPVVTNCGRSRTTEVVLHPTIYSISTEVLGKIHERMRSFEVQVRSQSSSRLKGKPVPPLNSIQKIPRTVNSDQAERAEVMRANGFVLAKMVRTKLLHIFLWGYVSNSPGWDEAISSGRHGYDLKNPHSSCRKLELDAAIKAMPLELFSQIVGSTQRFEDLVEKCRGGMRLSDLPVQEYKCLMDTRAMGRLSWLIDILRRLKLIRLVSNGPMENVAEVPHTTLAYALELRPYIEEPVSTISSSSDVLYPDLRPQIRHDFLLSSRNAIDEYWNTLEFCYAAATPKAALHAFPGSAVNEVFFPRSWASARVMTSDQRAELFKRIVSDDPCKKLSFKECEKIAKDLNLTLEQVLRLYYDRRQSRLNRLRGVLNSESEEIQPLKSQSASSSRKRKRPSRKKSSKHVQAEALDGQKEDQRLSEVSDTDNPPAEENPSAPTLDAGLESESNEGDMVDRSFMHKCALSKLKPARQKKFSWTEGAERQLVIEYVRHRAALGANFHRTDWASLVNLPAPPDTCKRRMALLNTNVQFRKSVMRLCNVLSKRYVKDLEDKQSNFCSSKVMTQGCSFAENYNAQFDDCGSETQWDDFNNNDVKVALDDVLHYKNLAKLEVSKGVHSVREDCSDIETNGKVHEIENHVRRSNVSAQRSSSCRLPRKYTKLINERITVRGQAYESVAVSNASELFKLIFLNASKAAEVPTMLAETLRHYSEHDLFAAFNFLREKKIMIGGTGTSPFALSQQFLQRISLSPFPTDTGRRAAKFASWLHEREKYLVEDGIDLPEDLQCGDVLHLCALVSAGELAITPFLPDEGVGEAEDTRTSKRKYDGELFDDNNSKKPRTSLFGEGEIISRREKGFPGIRLSVTRATLSRVHALDLFKEKDAHDVTLLGVKDQFSNVAGLKIGRTSTHFDEPNYMNELGNHESITCTVIAAGDSAWEAMASYGNHLLASFAKEHNTSFHPELFRNVYLAIQKTGDQGLSMKEISQLVNMQGETTSELLIEVLEAFGKVLKVNAYNSIHVVDSLYRSKYFVTSLDGSYEERRLTQSRNLREKNDNHSILTKENHENCAAGPQEMSEHSDEVHRVTILNFPEEVAEPSDKIEGYNKDKDYTDREVNAGRKNQHGEACEFQAGKFHSSKPILPWLNGDGTINELVYKGLVRRALGIVMQNPGILEDDIIKHLRALNPQSCKSLLEMMILDNHIIRRPMHQTISSGPPAILGSYFGGRLEKPSMVCREHFFANPMSTALL